MKTFLVRLFGFGLILLGSYLIIGKQILMPFLGVSTHGRVVGFKNKNSNTISKNSYSSSKVLEAKSAYFRFLPEGQTDSLTIMSDGGAFISFLNYNLNDSVKVAYWKNHPKTATIISWRAYPLIIFLVFIGGVFAFGKAPDK